MSWLDFVRWFIRERAYRSRPIAPVPPPVEPPTQPDSPAERMRLLNQARLEHGVHWLPASTGAMQAADFQSDWQAERGEMGHGGPPGMEGVGDRLAHFGVSWRGCGEIVAECPIFAEAVDLWLDSPGHRKIMLDPTWTHAGVAMTGRYATAVFHR